MNHEPKISTVEAFALISAAGLIDATGIALVIFGLDDFFLLDIVGATSQLYFRMKGVSKAGLDLATTTGEAIPYVGALPLKTLGILVVIWADRHPESAVAKITEKAATKIPAKGIKTPVGGLKKAV